MMPAQPAAEELLPRIIAHPGAQMEGVLDRQGPIWDLIQEHPSYDEVTTDFVDPLGLSDQAVFADGSVLAWSQAEGWVASRGEHSPFPRVRLMAAPEKQPAWPLTIEVGGLPPSPNRRMNWQACRRVVKPMADAVAWQARAFGRPQPLERAHVVATLVHRRSPLRDFDNAVSSLKELIDALITGGLIASDAPAHLHLEVVQTFGSARGVLLEVWPAEQTAAPGLGASDGEKAR